MAYIVPRVLINQEFSSIPAFSEQPLAALIIGPQYKLFRYAEAAEKPFTVVDDGVNDNAYQYAADTTYGFPNRPAGAVVDDSFVKVFMEKAQVKYFPNATLGSVSAAIAKVATTSLQTTNRFLAGINLATSSYSSRNAVFSNRDVKAGDKVKITDGTTTVLTTIQKLLAVPVAASVTTPATGESSNKAVVSTSTSVSSPSGGITAVANSSTVYVGYNALGIVSDVYTAVCTHASTGTAGAGTTWTITSANSAIAVQTGVTVSSAILTLDNNSGNNVKVTFATAANSIVVGDTVTVTVAATVTLPSITVAGTYTGTSDIVYRLTVVRGGPLYNGSNGTTCARIAVTSNGTDSSATVNVQAATAFPVGTLGVTASFAGGSNNGGLILGDVYDAAATAQVDGNVRIVETTDVLPSTLVGTDSGLWTMSLYLMKDVEVPVIRSLSGNTVNWTTDIPNSTITVKAGFVTTDSSLVVSSTPVDLTVEAGNLYVQHRDLLTANTTAIASLNDASTVLATLGTVHPDNPLAQGVYNAALNSNGVAVYYANVISNDLAGYTAALELAKKTNRYHGVTPLTFDSAIQDLVVSHVNTMSTAENAKWRVAWLSKQVVESAIIVDNKTATTATNVVTSATALFITGTTPVRPGDQFLTNYRLDSNGKVINDTYTVDVVLTDTTLRLTTNIGTNATAIAYKINRVYTKDEQIDQLAQVAGEYNNRRVRVAFPDTVKSGTVEQPGYFVASALAGLRSGVVPHQGLTNTTLLGFDDVSKSSEVYTDTQLNRLAEEGVWIISQTVVGATPYVRHQLTTDETSLNTSEDSPTSNVDSISYGLQKVVSPFIGRYNRNSYTLDLIRNAVFNELLFRQTGTFTETAGNQLNGFTIVKIAANATFADRIDIQVKLEVPYPYNFINITLYV